MAGARCRVCGEKVGERDSAVCSVCDACFHLNPRNDIEGKNCGQVWIDEQYMALRFACFTCLREAGGEGQEPAVGQGH